MLAMPEDEHTVESTEQQTTHVSIEDMKQAAATQQSADNETQEIVHDQSSLTENSDGNNDKEAQETIENKETHENEESHSHEEKNNLGTSELSTQESSHASQAKPSDIDALFKTEDPQLMKEQLKYCATILKGLKRHRDGTPFLVPVDPIALGIPDYPNIIKNPMDLSTITKKLEGNEYVSASDFVGDVRLMLNNCFTFNAADSQVAKMGRNLEKYLNNCLAKMPVNMEQATALATAASPGRTQRRKSDTMATSPMATRPRRDTSAPTSRRGSNSNIVYNPPAATASSKAGKRQAGDITFCRQVLGELTKKTNANINWPFMQPVDPIALGIPDYFTVIKHPMDLGTIRRKLDHREYVNAEQFEQDVRLVFSNCFTYNAPDTDIVQMAKALESIFEAKWAQRPIRTPNVSSSSHSSVADHPHHVISDDIDDEERILALSQQISDLQSELNALLKRKKTGKPRHTTGGSTSSASAVSSYNQPSTTASTVTAHATIANKPPQKRTAAQLEEELNKPMTFEEKRQLSNDVNQLPPEKLFKVVEIIHDSMPNLRENADSDVIELDVETLDVRTLRKLQRYVRECTKKRKSKPASASSSATAAAAKKSASQPSTAAPTASSAEAVPFPVESSDESSDESGDE